jgi:hypothetical protein
MRRLSPYSQPETPPRGRSDTRGRLSQRTSHRTHLSQRHGLRPDMEPRRQVLPQPCQAKDFGDQTFATIHVGTPAWTGHIAGATLRQHRLRDSGWGWPNRSTRRPQDRGHHRRKLSKWSLITSANAADQRLATLREPHRPILSRVRCIGWFANITHGGGLLSLPSHAWRPPNQ